MEYKEFGSSYLESIKAIYKQEEWNAYLKDDLKLKRAFDNSLYVLGAFDNDKLIGFIRAVGDGEHIVLIQDLIVHKNYQKQGIGTKLINALLEKYKDVRMIQVNTDLEDEVDNRFYQSLKFNKLEKGHMVSYFK